MIKGFPYGTHGPKCCSITLIKLCLRNSASGFVCDNATVNMCKKYSASWKVSRIDWDQLHLSDCNENQLKPGEQLLLFVSGGKLYNYGKYEIVTVKLVAAAAHEKG